MLYGIEAYTLVRWSEPFDLQSLNKLGQRMAMVNYPNPEQPSPTENSKHKNPDELQRQIEAIVGSLNVPECFGRKPIDCGGASLASLFIIGQLETLVNSWPEVITDILEIGAGTGLTAYFAKRCGCDSYTIIDIPTTAVIAAYCLAKTLGEKAVWLYGEPERSAYVNIYPASRYDEVGGPFSMVFNSNSFPEMPEDVQDRYVEQMPNWLGTDGIFYSCNHESDLSNQRSVAQAFKDSLQRIYRAPFMVRDGYLEEIFVPK
jgi:putative sugar O-methyltransferase